MSELDVAPKGSGDGEQCPKWTCAHYQGQNYEVLDSGSKENASSHIVEDKVENLLRFAVCKLQPRAFDDQGLCIFRAKTEDSAMTLRR